MTEQQFLSSEEAQRRLLLVYGRGQGGEFAEFAIRPLLNPVEQRAEKNRRNIHPMLVIGVILLLVGAAAAFFFTH